MKSDKQTDGIGKYMKKLKGENWQREDDEKPKGVASFSDADLKRLKEAITKVDAEIGSTDRYMNTMLKAGNLAALLARLEAAEVSDAWGRAGHTLSCKDHFNCTCGCNGAREAWRKSKGE
jgi:hypothetical protein